MKSLFYIVMTIWVISTLTLGQVPTDSLIAYYPFNGDAYDESGNENNGIVFGATTSIDRFDSLNSSYDFDGDDDYIQIQPATTEMDYQNLDILSVSLWINWDGSGYQRQYLWDQRGSPSDMGMILFLDMNSGVKATDGNDNSIAVASLPIVGDWTHYLGIWDKIKNNIMIYKNGFLEQSVNWVPSGGTSSGVKFIAFCGCTYPDYKFNGRIDDVRLYKKALDDFEIDLLYHESEGERLRVLNTIPYPNSKNISKSTDISILFSESLNQDSITSDNFFVLGDESGRHDGVFSFPDTNALSFNPTEDFHLGEKVTVTLTDKIVSLSGKRLTNGYNFKFTIQGQFPLVSVISSEGNSPSGITCGDFNNDNNIDFLVVNRYSNAVTIFMNDGTGSFTMDRSYPVGDGPLYAIPVDINNDGYLDIVASNNYGDSVTVLKNDGLGSFIVSSTIPVGGGPLILASGDFNSDGAKDIAVVNHSTNNVSVLMNDGLGFFPNIITLSVGNDPEAIVASDFDKDGDIDLAISNFYSNNIMIFSNDGLGNFTLTTTIDLGGHHPQGMISGDWDNDGDIDLVTTNWNTGTASFIINNGNGNFYVKNTMWSGDRPSNIVAGDINGDGNLDLAMAINWETRFCVMKNDGTGNFTVSLSPQVDIYSIGITGGDIDNDGDFDILMSNSNSNTISIYKNGGENVNSLISGMSFKDINGNGIKDIEEPGTSNHTINLFRNGSVLKSTLTSSFGNYLFKNLLPGTYSVKYGTTGYENIIVQQGTIATSKNFSTTGNSPDTSNLYTNSWNMISIPVIVSDKRRIAIFSTAISDAFSYQGSYIPQDTLDNGFGYWLKFDSPQSIVFNGTPILLDTIDVNKGWNMIGTISSPVSTSNITSIPPSIITSEFFGYSDNYFSTAILKPGKGYWVKVNQDGALILSSSLQKTLGNRIKIIPTSEMPPQPPTKDIIYSQMPSEYTFTQNYPNPFNPSTTIEFGLPQRSHVSITIYNVLGQQVATLVNEIREAGYFKEQWNVSQHGIASGVYYYHLNAIDVNNPSKSFSQVKKMSLLR